MEKWNMAMIWIPATVVESWRTKTIGPHGGDQYPLKPSLLPSKVEGKKCMINVWFDDLKELGDKIWDMYFYMEAKIHDGDLYEVS